MLVLLVLGFLLASTGRAQVTWDGGGTDALWGTANNWSTNTVPASPYANIVTFAGATRLTPDMSTPWSVTGVSFTGASAFNLTNSTLTISSASGISNTNTNTTGQIISSNVTLGIGQSWTTANGNLTVSGAINNGGFLLTTSSSTAAKAVILSGLVSGSGGLTVASGAGSTNLTNSANSYTGTTTVNSGGTLVVAAGNSTATLGALGNTSAGTTVTSGGTLGFNGGITYGAAEAVTVGGTGVSANVGAIHNLGGTNSFAGPLTLSAATTFSSVAATSLTLSGGVNLGTQALTSGKGTSTGNIVLSGAVNGTGTNTSTILNVAAGTLTLSNATSNYTGNTSIASGATLIVAAGNSSATAGALGNIGVSNNATTVVSGGTLAFSGGISYGIAEQVTASGTGVGANGAIQNLLGNNSFAGPITLGAATTFSAANTTQLTLSGNVNLGANAITIGTATNAGNIVLSGNVNGTGTNTSTILNVATGTLTLSNATSNYTGNTSIASGATLIVAAGNSSATAGALGNIGVSNNATTVVSGGTLAFSGGISYGIAEQVTASGTGVGGNGAIQNLLGTNSFAGPITLGATTTASAVNATQLTLSGNVNLGSNTLTLGTVTNTGNFVLSGNVNGAGGLTIASGNVTLANATNTYAGTTTITGGTLKVSSDANLGAVPGSVTPASITLGGGTLEATTGFTTLSTNRGITLSSSTTSNLIADTGVNMSYGGVITGSGNIVLGAAGTGTGTITLTGTNNFTGSTTINAGTLKVGSDANLGAVPGSVTPASITLGGGTLEATTGFTTLSTNRGITLTSSTSSNLTADTGVNLSYGGVITGAGNIGFGTATTGTGNITLSGTSNYTGTTNVVAGNVIYGTNNALGTTTALTVSSGAKLDLAAYNATVGSLAGGGTIDLSTASASKTLTVGDSSSTTFSGVIQDSGSGSSLGLTKQGSGTLTLSGTNSYQGATTINAGSISIAQESNLGANPSASNAAQLTLNGGTLATTATFSITDTNRGVTLGSSGGTFNVANATTLTVNSVITGSGLLTKTGTEAPLDTTYSTLILTRSNSYTGGTNILTGGLQINNGGALGTGAITVGNSVSSEAALVFNATANSDFTLSTSSPITIYGSGRNDDGAIRNESVGNVTVASNIVLGSDSRINNGIQGGNLTLTGGISGAFAFKLGGTSPVLATGVISTTSFEKTANGTVTLTGTNTYGTTTITAGAITPGTLQIGNGSTTGTLGTGDVTNNANLSINRSNSYSITNNMSGTGNFIQTGTGTTTLTGVNTYTGNTTISGGTLVLDKTSTTSALSSSTALTFNGTGTLRVVGNSTQSRSQTVNGLTLTGGAASVIVDNASGPSTTLALGAITHASGGATVDFSAQNGILGTTALITTTTAVTNGILGPWATVNGGTDWAGKSGSNIVAYTGYTDLTGANPNIVSNAASNVRINSSSTGTVGLASATTDINSLVMNDATGRTVSSGNILRLGAVGGILTAGGSHTITGGTLTAGGAANTAGEIITNVGSNLTVGSVIANNGSGVVSLTKSGAGNLTLTNTNTYTGTTTINTGNLFVGNGGTVGTLGAGGAVTNYGTLTFNRTDSVSVSNVIGGTGNLTMAGTGTLTLSGASTFTGAVAINNGTVVMQNNSALGVGTLGTTVASGAALKLEGGLSAAQNGTLTLSGTGVSSSGALYTGTTGNNRWANNLSILNNTTISNNSTGTLDLGKDNTAFNRALYDPTGTPTDSSSLSIAAGKTLTLTAASGAGITYVNARISGSGNLTVNNTDTTTQTWFTANMNDQFTGTTTVNKGTLVLNALYNTYPNDPVNPNHFGINGPVVIGNASDAANSATFSIRSGTTNDEMMNFTTDVTINKSGNLSLLAAQTIDTLTLNGGANINLGTTGGLYLMGDVTVNGVAGQTATISGTGTSTLSLTQHQGPSPVANANRVFTIIGDGDSVSDLTVNAKINNGSITKNGNGLMSITYNNTGGYEGTTTINNGILSVQHNNGLGQGDNMFSHSTTDMSTVVNSGGTLQLSNVANGNLTISNEALRLNGAGYNSTKGALQNLVGNNTWAGIIELGSDASIRSEANLLTISGTITNQSGVTAPNLSVYGSGNTTISGAIGTGGGGITKFDTGTLILSGSNGYNGTTTVKTGGVLSVQNNNALGSASTGTIVESGGALHLDNTANGDLTVIAEPLKINGSGISSTGAFRNVSGNNTYQGQIDVQSSALISSNSGLTLTTTGGAVSSHASPNLQTLTVGTTAQNGDVAIKGNFHLNTSGTNDGLYGTAVNLTKEGTGNLSLLSTTNTKGTVGAVALNEGTMSVGFDSTNSLTTGAFSSKGIVDGLAANTTLTIATGATINAKYDSGNTNFNGIMAGGGTFAAVGAAGTTLTMGTDFTASSLTLKVGGTGTSGTFADMKLNPTNYFTFKLGTGVDISVGTLEITGDTILDFNGASATTLSSVNLILGANVHVLVTNWSSLADAWYATSQVNGATTGVTVFGGSPLTQISFADYSSLTTTWVVGTAEGWLHKEIRPTPEPSTYGAIFISGCVGLLGWRRYRSQKTANTTTT